MKQFIYFILIGSVFLLSGCGGPDRSHRLVVIDAGHGGHDCGAQCGGKQEKDAVLQIVQKLYREFKREGYRVYMTRGNDRFLTLGQRTRIADKKDADVFISIHANAIANKSRFETVEGIETYFLQKTRDAKSQRIAARENAAVLQGTDALSKNVIIDSVLNGPKIVESNKLAIDVQKHIMKCVKAKYRDAKSGGVRPAPFYVLVGASRPSILVEVGYITNTKERNRLFNPDYQERIAEGIVEGVNRYLDNREKELGI
ncbi:MAG: N-acetylmuramoyl-L-alanine amidase [Sulfurovum sp.]|nr:N-acetylmuramoyl-L-alanine amidase [Sulfurovum sp.]